MKRGFVLDPKKGRGIVKVPKKGGGIVKVKPSFQNVPNCMYIWVNFQFMDCLIM